MKTQIPPQFLKFAAYGAIILSVICIGAGIMASYQVVQEEQAIGKLQEDQLIIQNAAGKKHAFKIELAITQDEMAKGLMFREKLEEGAGMLFIHNRVQEVSMWMKNTKIPLDMLFIDNSGKILHIVENARPFEEKMISSRYPVRAVLELAAGEVAKRGIAVGDTAFNSYFGNVGQ